MDDTATAGSGDVPARASRRPPGRRDELLAAALDVIRLVGPDASMDEMAAAAAITKPVLYRYFGDRDGLIAAVAERFSDVLVSRLAQALVGDPRQDAEVLIRAAIESYVAFIEEDPALYGFLTQQAPLGGPALVAVIDRVAGSISEVMREALDARGLDTRPATTWAHGVVGMVHLSGARWARHPDVPREQLVADLVTLVARGLIGAATPGPQL
ncbi:MAG: TetR/AcrR family transcriptional regulator [Acidimicrobiales bacterium]